MIVAQQGADDDRQFLWQEEADAMGLARMVHPSRNLAFPKLALFQSFLKFGQWGPVTDLEGAKQAEILVLENPIDIDP